MGQQNCLDVDSGFGDALQKQRRVVAGIDQHAALVSVQRRRYGFSANGPTVHPCIIKHLILIRPAILPMLAILRILLPNRVKYART